MNTMTRQRSRKAEEIRELAEQLTPEQLDAVLPELRARVEWHRALQREKDAALQREKDAANAAMARRVGDLAAQLADLDYDAALRIAEVLERQVAELPAKKH